MRAFLLVYSFALLSASCKAQSDLDFETTQAGQLPSKWGIGKIKDLGVPKDAVPDSWYIDTQIKHHGNQSLCLDLSTADVNWVSCGYPITKIPRNKIKLTGFIKTEAVFGDGSAGLWLRLDSNDKTVAFDNMATTSRSIHGTTDWRQYSIIFEDIPQGITSVLVGGLLTGRGKLWIDDLHVYVDGKEVSIKP